MRFTWANRIRICSVLLMICGLNAGGCENAERQADRKVRAGIRQSELTLLAEGDGARAYALLQEASQVANAGPAARYDALIRLGESDYAAAMAQWPALAESEAQIQAKILQIDSLLGRIQQHNALNTASRQADPAGPQGPLEKLKASRDRFLQDLKNVTSQVQSTDSLIRAKAADIAALERARSETTLQAAALLQKSEAAAAQQSVDLFREAAEARARAGVVAIQISRAQADLTRLQRQLGELQDQKAVLQGSVAAVDRQIKQVQDEWAGIRETVAQRIAASRKLAESPGIADLAKELTDQMSRADLLRDQISVRLEQAVRHFEAADASAGAVVAAMQTLLANESRRGSPDSLCWRKLQQLYSPMEPRLRAASVDRARGDLLAAQLMLLKSRQSLGQKAASVFKEAGLTPPAALVPAGLAQEIQKLSRRAMQVYSAADSRLVEVLDLGEEQHKRRAILPRVGVQYAMYLVGGSEKNLAEARALTKALVGEGADASRVSFSAFPPELLEGLPLPAAPTVLPPQESPGTTTGRPEAPAGRARDTWQKIFRRAGGAFGQQGSQR